MNPQPSYYTILPADVRYDVRLTYFEKILFSEIVALYKKDSVCWASNGYFAKNLDASIRTVSRSIGNLKNLGYVTLTFDDEGYRHIYLASHVMGGGQKRPLTPGQKRLHNNTRENNNKYIYGVDKFDLLWVKYPSKDGKRDALRHFQRTVKTKEDWDSINKALDNYVNSKRVRDGFVKNGSTWFNNWQDWIEWKEKDGTNTPGIFREKG